MGGDDNQAHMKSADFLRSGTRVIHMILETSHPPLHICLLNTWANLITLVLYVLEFSKIHAEKVWV